MRIQRRSGESQRVRLPKAGNLVPLSQIIVHSRLPVFQHKNIGKVSQIPADPKETFCALLCVVGPRAATAVSTDPSLVGASAANRSKRRAVRLCRHGHTAANKPIGANVSARVTRPRAGDKVQRETDLVPSTAQHLATRRKRTH